MASDSRLVAKTPPWLLLHVARYCETASMTRRGTCVPPGPSRKIGVRPLRCCCKAGNSRRSAWTSNMAAPLGCRVYCGKEGIIPARRAVADRLLRDVGPGFDQCDRIAVKPLA